eukprot:TRINITY_DN27728_c1_g2_i1.p1 TRINITY_DN27728_c1_g2~~TRINITY_DN27728_c1_g2_i1.p1  ORF type:complete len:794 (-),score=115.35 TRINITY_DN27728_c1_g2_i1:235-2580(-)
MAAPCAGMRPHWPAGDGGEDCVQRTPHASALHPCRASEAPSTATLDGLGAGGAAGSRCMEVTPEPARSGRPAGAGVAVNGSQASTEFGTAATLFPSSATVASDSDSDETVMAVPDCGELSPRVLQEVDCPTTFPPPVVVSPAKDKEELLADGHPIRQAERIKLLKAFSHPDVCGQDESPPPKRQAAHSRNGAPADPAYGPASVGGCLQAPQAALQPPAPPVQTPTQSFRTAAKPLPNQQPYAPVQPQLQSYEQHWIAVEERQYPESPRRAVPTAAQRPVLVEAQPMQQFVQVQQQQQQQQQQRPPLLLSYDADTLSASCRGFRLQEHAAAPVAVQQPAQVMMSPRAAVPAYLASPAPSSPHRFIRSPAPVQPHVQPQAPHVPQQLSRGQSNPRFHQQPPQEHISGQHVRVSGSMAVPTMMPQTPAQLPREVMLQAATPLPPRPQQPPQVVPPPVPTPFTPMQQYREHTPIVTRLPVTPVVQLQSRHATPVRRRLSAETSTPGQIHVSHVTAGVGGYGTSTPSRPPLSRVAASVPVTPRPSQGLTIHYAASPAPSEGRPIVQMGLPERAQSFLATGGRPWVATMAASPPRVGGSASVGTPVPASPAPPRCQSFFNPALAAHATGSSAVAAPVAVSAPPPRCHSFSNAGRLVQSCSFAPQQPGSGNFAVQSAATHAAPSPSHVPLVRVHSFSRPAGASAQMPVMQVVQAPMAVVAGAVVHGGSLQACSSFMSGAFPVHACGASTPAPPAQAAAAGGEFADIVRVEAMRRAVLESGGVVQSVVA